MRCIQCHSDENLNTNMKVEIDGVEYEIHLCDQHAETATMGSIKAKVSDIIQKLTKSIVLATDLGINILDVLPAKVAAQIMPQVKSVSKPAPRPAGGGLIEVVDEMPEDLVEKPKPTPRAAPRQPKVAAEEAAPITDGQTIPEGVAINTNVKQQTITGRGGKPTAIPRKIDGKFGTTDIRIAKTTDAELQKRFRALNEVQDSEGAFGNPCIACGGQGVHPMTNDVCPKCKGSGTFVG